MHSQEIWDSPHSNAKLIRTLLLPASWLYGLGWQAYLGVYHLGLKHAKHPHSPVVCIGNLRVGGSGKTPATIAIAQVLKGLGQEVAISCSGYGSPRAEAATLAPEGPLKASEWGDEAALLRQELLDMPIIVGRRRVLAAVICHEHYPKSVMLMDDGFQHLPLHKDVTILLDPDGQNYHCLPAGPYREPRGNRVRATTVFPDHFRVVVEPVLDQKPPRLCNVLCALGNPESFLDTVSALGCEIAEQKLLPDHDPLTEGSLLERWQTPLPILVTLKDDVKLRERPDYDPSRIMVVRQKGTIEPAEEFAAWLKGKLSEIQA